MFPIIKALPGEKGGVFLPPSFMSFGPAAFTDMSIDESGSYHQSQTLLPLSANNNLLQAGAGFFSSYIPVSISRNDMKFCERTKYFLGVEAVRKNWLLYY